MVVQKRDGSCSAGVPGAGSTAQRLLHPGLFCLQYPSASLVEVWFGSVRFGPTCWFVCRTPFAGCQRILFCDPMVVSACAPSKSRTTRQQRQQQPRRQAEHEQMHQNPLEQKGLLLRTPTRTLETKEHRGRKSPHKGTEKDTKGHNSRGTLRIAVTTAEDGARVVQIAACPIPAAYPAKVRVDPQLNPEYTFENYIEDF